ncbi:histone-lysine N-methyltransferase G9a [Xylocopa sonorina]|uniref:histone-lysine N-methyltransferase G9a n=1 Tax=Xylocopa sonorina TaxID=1818115 RepID=UPI00403A9B03
MSENKSKEDATVEGCQEGGEEEAMAAERVEDKVSIQQILEGMTNEFNKTVSPVKNADTNRSEKSEHEEIEGPVPTLDGIPAIETEFVRDQNEEAPSIKQNAVESISADENHKEDESIGKQDILKKDNGIPRIVLTFRTIDENTDHGKKTKISSCSTNLTLMPDELANCDQIGGVSVKIENSDENSDTVEKSDSEEGRTEELVKEPKIKEAEKSVEELKSPKEDGELATEEGATITNEKAKVEEADASAEPPEQVDQADSTVPVTRKRRTGRPRLRALSDHTEEPPGPKRSARRLCKESLKSTVLESAMARKEKSNYTEENLQFKKQRKYNKPGRPKKVMHGKDQNKQLQTKPPDIRQEVESSISDGNITMSEVNSTLECSRNSTISENSANETILDESQSFSSEFDGMPKLSPMIKSSDSQAKLSNSIGSPASDDIPLADIEKPFLKPAAGRPKRERGRPRGSQAARKIAKADSFEDGTVSVAETGKNNDYPEEGTVPAKRTRRSMAPSPSPAEGQASKPESTAIMSETYGQSMMCLCQVRSQLYVTITGSGAPLYCTAIDSIDNRLVGCCNEVDSNDVAMRRPSTRVPFIILCRMHKERLLRHNCCPSCGLFCSQGRFVQCINGHQYHRECEVYPNKKGVCPHCGNESAAYDVMVTMSGLRKPVFIPTRKKFSKLPSAKMSLPGKGDNTKLAERPPSPLIQADVIKIPEPSINSERPERYTIMSLYTSVKNGDLEKLVNVLACGYNANHTFRDYAHRTGLHIAADKGHLSCVHVLVQAGAQLDVMDRNQLTPLMLAASKGKADVVKYLIRIGADVTLKGEDGMTALHMAAKSGHLDVCRIILTECKAPRTLVDSVDDGGWTSLIWACEFCHTDVARFLLDKKCDPLIRDAEQNIALHWSAFSGSSEITEMLLNEGCDVNAVNVHGDTPLHIAARQDQYAVSILLLARGAKIGEINAAGETAVNCCTNDGDTMSALRLNAKVNELSEHMWEKTVKILTNDISRGKETNPIQCVNGYDSEDKPTDFLYVTENCFTSNINVDRTITSLQSCRCEDNCSSEKCLCGNISLRCWYDEEGKLIPEFNYADPPMLFECNPACDCNRITCNNRVVQHGLTQRFQLFRTKGKGWGLRTLRHIPKGSYVCEYVGEIISDSEADHREDDSYLFDLDNRDGETYCIDARRYGNIARFINHSCAPNLLPVRVFVEHQDLHFPRIAFFANRDIEADEELGFDYGEKFWIIKCKSFTCTCGAENCRYSEKTIQVTLDNYRRKIQQEEMLAAQSS